MTWFWVWRALVLSAAVPFLGVTGWTILTDPPQATWRRLRWPMVALGVATLILLLLMPR